MKKKIEFTAALKGDLKISIPFPPTKQFILARFDEKSVYYIVQSISIRFNS